MNDQGKLHAPTFGKVPPELMHDTNITDGTVRLYAHMHWRYGNNHDNHEGQKSMAKYLGVSEVTIHNRIAELEAADWVVTIERSFNKKTGNFSTNFYHVFVSQEECRAFREEYILQEGEVMYEKPLPAERKLRKGKGGNSKNLPNHANSSYVGHANSGYAGGHNSSYVGHANSGYDNPDSSDLDTIEPDTEKTVAPSGAPASNTPPEIVLIPNAPFEVPKGLKSMKLKGLLEIWQSHKADLDALRKSLGVNGFVPVQNEPDKAIREYIILYGDLRRAHICVERYEFLMGKVRSKNAWKKEKIIRCTDVSAYIPEFLSQYPPAPKPEPKPDTPDPLANVAPILWGKTGS